MRYSTFIFGMLIAITSFAQPSSSEAIERFKSSSSNNYLKTMYHFESWDDVKIVPLKWSSGDFWNDFKSEQVWTAEAKTGADYGTDRKVANVEIHIPKKYNEYEVIQPIQIIYERTAEGYDYCCANPSDPNIIGYKGASNEEKLEVAVEGVLNPQDGYINKGLEKYIRIDSITVLGMSEIQGVGKETWKFVVHGTEANIYKDESYSKTRSVKRKLTMRVEKSGSTWNVTSFSLPTMTFGVAGDWEEASGQLYGTYKFHGGEGVYQVETPIDIEAESTSGGSSSGSSSSGGGGKKKGGMSLIEKKKMEQEQKAKEEQEGNKG